VAPLELWGGVECTINRVGDCYFDQLDRNGHTARISDFDRFAALGVKAIRQSALWERTLGDGDRPENWAWTDAAFARLQELNVRPIVGLVHHGSGPRHTDLLDPHFPEKVAEYARKVAERYPWVTDYTPVNEPLTTARFSGLYGHWYPHGHDDRTFVRALINECRATILSMAVIRDVTPGARLIQTEDLGKTFSTPKLAYQAHFENERRWLGFDLLLGRVDSDHFMWKYLLESGISQQELAWFLENRCVPSVLGINHYLSGERFLDENLDRYPADTHGGNRHGRYADVLAARVREDGAAGPRALLMEAWQRYSLPIAVTECHNGCTREEQLRWFMEVWDAAEAARNEGANVQAVTAWSLLGAFDWDSLVTQSNGHYEPGVFDIRSTPPRATASARLIADLAAQRQPQSPLLQVPGWWKRCDRFVYGISVDNAGFATRVRPQHNFGEVRPILITGATGTLGAAFARFCLLRGIPHRLLSRAELDIADQTSIRRALFLHHPWAVINTAGYVRVDDAEHDLRRCYRENVEGPALLASECRDRGIQLLTFSSDLVFDGDSTKPYVESDPVRPLNQYGWSKAEAEARTLQILPSALVIRSSAFFGPWDEYNFVTLALRSFASEQPFTASSDVIVSPTYVPDLVQASLDLLIDGEKGIWHLANCGAISWADLAERAADLAGLSAASLRRVSTEEMRLPAERPLFSALSSERGLLLPELDHALQRYLRDLEFRLEPQVLAA
jgi:dTDP-4-dehydrorhamnose reductase